MMVQRLKLAGVAVAGFAFVIASQGAALAQTPPAASKCSSGELKATGKKAACKTGILAKAAAKNLPPDTAKLAVCGQKFSAAFAKAAAGTDCKSNVSEGTIETKVDNFVNDLNSEIAVSVSPAGSKCQGGKLKVAGKKAGCLLGVDATGIAKGIPPDTVKHAACSAKMSAAFAKADGGTTCGSTTGDYNAIENKVDTFESDVLNEENPPTTTTTRSTTTSTTSSTTTSTTTSTTKSTTTSTTSSSTTSTTTSNTTTTTMGPLTFIVHVGPSGTLTFSPASLTIKAGDTVLWVWDSSFHTVTSGTACTADGKFCSPSDTNCAAGLTSSAGTMYRHTFTTTGTFPYFCATHCTLGMVGSITVQ